MTLTSVRLLGRHLTPDNHEAVLEKAKGQTLKKIDVLVATLAPQPDAPSLVRRLPIPTPVTSSAPVVVSSVTSELLPMTTPPPAPTPRPVVRPTAPERYRVQFTIGESTHEKLRRLQTLLRREIPDGDPGVIFDRAVTLLLAQVENRKLGVTAKPRSIRRETDSEDIRMPPPPSRDMPAEDIRTPPPPSRNVPRWVRDAVWKRDAGQCAFVSTGGRRCTERTFLQFHHVQPHARRGPATVENISLRCWRHNQYEAELVFGRRGCAASPWGCSARITAGGESPSGAR
jgi:hypothetical protein